jgi:hypothetical protein
LGCTWFGLSERDYSESEYQLLVDTRLVLLVDGIEVQDDVVAESDVMRLRESEMRTRTGAESRDLTERCLAP